MAHTVVDEQKLRHALDDLGTESHAIEQVIQSVRSGRRDNGKRILATHRARLLSAVHETRDKLYSMDYLIRTLSNSDKTKL